MDQVRGLQDALAKLGRDKVRIGTDFTMRALYR
ncbi:MAG: SIMPL domain-containing protein, partial [Asticcacaulis sp.]|nr:SIMPL domain-containing protein [Asticcacaulis sp.]